MVFIISFFVIYILVHYYVFNKIAIVFRLETNAYFTILAVFLFLAIWGILAQYFSHKIIENNFIKSFIGYGYIWFGVISIMFSLFFITDIMYIFIRNNQFVYYSTLIACVLTVICSIYSVFNVYRGPVIKNISINVPNLSVNQFTIVQLADTHIDSFTSYKEVQNIVKMTNELNPDIVVLAGDILESNLSQEYQSYNLDKIKSKYGVFAVSGNHEYYTGINEFNLFCDNIKATIVHNTNILIEDILYVSGIPDMKMSKHFDSQHADIKKSFQNIDFKKPVIFLSHQPTAFFESSKYPITLQLSGHTHAGQIPPFDLIEYIFFKYYYGLYKKDNTYLYVTSGTRWWGPPMRLFSRSEIVCINLYK
ncbi:MAG: metallophosphoesterase [Endomicrobiia bacterium]|nr:metallophosphoesterase [Endomicrobiaceae bacterium]MDD3053064.1 metallophosphoesterase [Endomicrobiaceae bacterium]MDD3922228.1 metallophosphoesterase [Endomicrobiaceae bacterium]